MVVIYPPYEEVLRARQLLSDVSYQHWLHDEFLTWKWWLLLALTVLPYFVWWRIADKRRLHELLLYGLLMGMLAVITDDIGTQLLWWSYPDKLLQMVPPLFPADIVLVPVAFMTLSQYVSGPFWRFLVANALLGALLAYVGEPIFIALEFYRLHTWRLSYSFAWYIVAAVTARAIVRATRART